MRVLLSCFLLVLAVLPAEAAPVELKLWHAYRAQERTALEKTIALFHASQEEIRVKLTFISYDAYLDKLNAAIPLGHGPDLFIVSHDRIGNWADSGMIAALDPLLASGTINRFFKKTVEPLVYRRKLYGLPTSFKSAVLFYNRDLVPQAPVDTREMIALAEKHSGRPADGGLPNYGLAWEHSDLYFHASWLFGFGGSLFDSAGEPVLDSPANVASLNFVRNIVAERKLAPLDVTANKVTSLFNEGRAAMVISGPWFRGEIDAQRINYGVALLPVITSTGRRARPFVGTEAFLLSARSTHVPAAVQAMDWLTGDKAARVRLLEGFQPVANHALYDAQVLQKRPAIDVFRQQLKYAVPMRASPEMGLVWVPIKHALENTVRGRASASEALAEAQRLVRLRIEEYRQGHQLKDRGQDLLPALAWGIGGGLFLLLLLSALFFRRLKRRLREVWRQRGAYAYLSPAVLATLVLIFFPFVMGLGLGFFRYYQGEYFFVGGKNFVDILSSREYSLTDSFSFYFKLVMTIVWTATNVFLHLTIGLGLALLLKDPLLKCKGLYRVLLIIPWAIPNYITAIIWRGMFDADSGVINHVLGLEGFSWWSSTSTAFAANLVANCWLGFPFMMVVCLGALQSIPRDLYEAADVDGASRWQQFRQITLPLLKPALFPAIILGTIWTFNMFNIIYLVSRGAPNGGTDILIIEAFRWAFERGDRYGYAAAYSTLIFLILFTYTLMTQRITKATEGVFD